MSPPRRRFKNKYVKPSRNFRVKSKKGKGAKYRREKRDIHRQQTEKDLEQQELESKILKVTEFVTVGEVATMMDVPTTDIISACMSLGIMVTMNQRLDAETLSIVAEEFWLPG